VVAAKTLAWLCPQYHVGSIDTAWISRNKETCDTYNADPLVYHKGIKASTGAACLTILPEVQSRLGEISLPILIVHGTEDKLCDIEGSRMLHAKAASTDKTLTEYEGAYHQLHHETKDDKERCVTQIMDWIMERTQSN